MALPKLMLNVPQEGYTFDDGEAVLRAKLSSGPSRFRLDMIDAPIEAAVQMVLSPFEYQYWMAFKRSQIARGSLPFLMDLVIDTADVAEYQVQIVPGSIKTNVQGSAHIVQMQVEAKVSSAATEIDDTLIVLYHLYGEAAPQVLISLEKLVNVDLASLEAPSV